MTYPSKRVFRLLSLIGLLVMIAGYVLSEYQIPAQSKKIQDVLSWNYHGTPIPYDIIIIYGRIYSVAFIISALGFLFFQSWSRYALLFLLLVSILITPFLGLYVISGIHYFIGNMGFMFFFVPFVLCFFPPCNQYFKRDEASSSI